MILFRKRHENIVTEKMVRDAVDIFLLGFFHYFTEQLPGIKAGENGFPQGVINIRQFFRTGSENGGLHAEGGG